MAKDPAVLWYFGDWAGGTMTMTRHQKGCYIDLLCAQFNNGKLSLDEIKTVLGTDFGSTWADIQKKFERDESGLFFNKRLQEEKDKRIKYSESRRSNRNHMKQHMNNHMSAHMENENINKDINIKDVKEKKEVEKTWRNDFQIYLSDCKKAYKELINNTEFMERLQELNPKINILSSLEMGFIAYWGSEDGWKNKKAKKSKTIDWKSTIIKTIKLNAVYY